MAPVIQDIRGKLCRQAFTGGEEKLSLSLSPSCFLSFAFCSSHGERTGDNYKSLVVTANEPLEDASARFKAETVRLRSFSGGYYSRNVITDFFTLKVEMINFV